VITKLNLEIALTETDPTHNFREVDWGEFRESLTRRLSRLDDPKKISTQEQLNVSCETLTTAIQEVIEEHVPKIKICSKSKH
jgi:hypothetical protein